MSMSDRHSPEKVRERQAEIVRRNPEDFAEPYPMPDPPPARIYVWFAPATGNIRKWSKEPFEEGAAYVKTDALAAKDAEIARLRESVGELLNWVDGLPVKHPQQSRARERARKLVESSED